MDVVSGQNRFIVSKWWLFVTFKYQYVLNGLTNHTKQQQLVKECTINYDMFGCFYTPT